MIYYRITVFNEYLRSNEFSTHVFDTLVFRATADDQKGIFLKFSTTVGAPQIF